MSEIALCAIGKFEEDYLQEWIEHHLKIGFDKIYFYDNNPKNNDLQKNICDKYLNDDKLSNIPIWEFLEIITFGELINFYEFFIKKYHISGDIKYVYILREIKKLRNAVAHNDNILDDLNIQKDHYDFSENNIIEFLDNANISKKTKINKLRNNHIKQITYTLYMFNEIVTSDGIKYDVKRKLKKFFYKRIPMNKEYYKDNELLKSVYEYFDKLINFFNLS